jgi:hypothetical protein
MRVVKNGEDNTIINEYAKDPIIYHSGVLVTDGYLSIFGTFDIETTNIHIDGEIRAIMYIWQFCIGDVCGEWRDVYVGRTWDDFIRFTAEIAAHYKLNDNKKMCVYIHNAAFEFQFMRSIFNVTRMFAVKKRMPVSFDVDYAFNFRCSYKLSNMSLSKFCEEEQAIHGKRTGYNYEKERFADTYLDDEELLYCIDDVLGLHEAITHLMQAGGDTLKSIPLTSTGFIRREARARVLSNAKNFFRVRDNALDVNAYVVCKSATRGGNTHTNALYSGQLLGVDDSAAPVYMWGYDKKSSYPEQMLSAPVYPMGKLVRERAHKWISDAANICHIVLKNVQLKAGVYFPYIAKSKCENMPRADGEYLYDNGRVLKAPILRMCITEIDWDIICRQYTFDPDYIIIDQYVADHGYLCKEYRDYIWELFKCKCELETGDPYFYAKFKNKINAAFGMMLTDITREDITYADNDWGSDLPPLANALYKYYKNRNSFLEYQHGLYVTASARAALQVGLDLVGIDGVYCDTDSVKALGNYDEQFNALNADITAQLERAGYGAIEVNGKTYTLGVWEKDATYSAFIAHGAKKYAYRYADDEANKPKNRGQIGVTVAGLSKTLGAKYLNEHGGLKAFTVGSWDDDGDYIHGALFDETNSGRLTAKYDDEIRHEYRTYKGHNIELTSNVALVPTTYELGLSPEYAAIVEMRDVFNDEAFNVELYKKLASRKKKSKKSC